MTRQEIAIKIAKITRIIGEWKYRLDLDDEVEIETLSPDLLHIDEWVREIGLYIKQNPSPILAHQITNIGFTDLLETYVQEHKQRGNPDDFVFVGFTYGSWTSLELQRWSLTAGLKKNLTFHCGRHTFAVLMLDLGADIYTVSKLLGHKELATTQIYAKVLDKNKQNAVSLIPNIE